VPEIVATEQRHRGHLEIPKRAVRRYLNDLHEKGLIGRSGAGKRGDPYLWQLAVEEAT
jgi:predicted ArsR family transcriptional regulator